MITQVSIKNFKCLRDVTVNLERFTVFVGANGSGKTSMLQAVDLLCRTFRAQPGRSEGEYLSHRSYGVTDEVELSCRSGEVHFRCRTNSQPQQRAQSRTGGGIAFAKDGDPLDWKPWQPTSGMPPSSLWLRLDTNYLRSAEGVNPPDYAEYEYAAKPDPRVMDANGQGLHMATASMSLEDPDTWSLLQNDLRRIVPSVQRLRHTPKSELLFDTVNGKGLNAMQISEGTLLTLGLLTAIHGVNKPGVLLLDDLDRALHPKAQRELIDLLRGVQATNPEIQILASTHSPYMLDGMQPNEVLVTSLRDDGSTACEPLTRHPKFEKWKDEFHPGEMWSFFGEKWVAGTEVATK